MDLRKEQERYRRSKPSWLGRGIERLTHPFGKALAGMVPQSLVESVLKGLDTVVAKPPLVTFDHDPANLAESHEAAKSVSRAASGISGASGAAAGFGGVVTASLDIPATIGIALRVIRDTGKAYGYAGEGPQERLFRLQVLELSALDDHQERQRRIAALEAAIGADGELIAADHEETTPVIDQVVERVSRAIALASFRSRAGMVVPVVGSAIGGIVNSSFQRDVGKAARFAFQERRLRAEEALASRDVS
ncbi:EcsC family protein [Aurantiacibacter poecillastricola]|uniref:EcsC family protein n=1 Tax=Aurantiacibacter poecillastricola TaxID=3064385 RepID=UPI00273F236C|nr:EcsC family protein [Aurantiacibacter sp. 219JJ12-13]MDP5262502.1 EcsC family protein [Aurantiacibacter sp. 219JJ12-13]